MSAEVIDSTRASKPAEAPPRRRAYRRVAFAPLVFLLLLGTLWAAAALRVDVRVTWLRLPLAATYVVAVLAVWVFVKGIWLKLG